LDDCVADETRSISRIDRSCVGKVDTCAAEKVDVTVIVSTRCGPPLLSSLLLCLHPTLANICTDVVVERGDVRDAVEEGTVERVSTGVWLPLI